MSLDHDIINVEPPKPVMTSYNPATIAIHADDHLAATIDVAPPMHVSTTFRYSRNPDELIPVSDEDVRIFPPRALSPLLKHQHPISQLLC